MYSLLHVFSVLLDFVYVLLTVPTKVMQMYFTTSLKEKVTW